MKKNYQLLSKVKEDLQSIIVIIENLENYHCITISCCQKRKMTCTLII